MLTGVRVDLDGTIVAVKIDDTTAAQRIAVMRQPRSSPPGPTTPAKRSPTSTSYSTNSAPPPHTTTTSPSSTKKPPAMAGCRFIRHPPGSAATNSQSPARRVRLDRLTDAGLGLYTHGIRTARAEQEHLLEQIDQAGYDLERMQVAMTGTNAATVDVAIRGIDIHSARANHAPDSVELTAWDVPVRIPGASIYLSVAE
ncbi:hypothetical protein ACIRCZ_19610 [Leifsonia sp. NPDC102414]|uniref:hypothetical protein n=1 Tax=Leifsonia sp. NPDC102414 TaxID=3364124 RepID=UPI003824A542